MLSVVILAAGKGTRMKSMLPKVLHPIGGLPMVERIINTAQSLNPRALHLVYGHGGDRLQETLANYNVNWCLQAEQHGTGHAVMQAEPHIHNDEDVLVLVGDAPLIQTETLQRLVKAKQSADVALLTVDLDDPTGMGRILRDGENIVGIVEHKDATDVQRDIREINTGMMIMNGGDLKRWLGALSNDNAQGEYYLTDVIAMAANEGKQIRHAQPDDAIEVEGINNRLQLSRLEQALQRRQAETLMMNGVSLGDPNRLDIRGTLTHGMDVTIDVNVVIEGHVTLGDNVYIGPNCVLTNCTIGENTRIEANSVIEQAQIAEQCSVGPFARLRPNAELKRGAKVGNFVEMKKSVLGEGAKANHLTYLGDADVGAGANIGAGTITCNYDGVNKSPTIIGEGAFIGSNSSLVAPVEIGANATIGAGSTITKQVDSAELSIARAKQRNVKGWNRPQKRS